MTVPCQGAEAPSAREGLCGANRVKSAEVPTNVKEVVARFVGNRCGSNFRCRDRVILERLGVDPRRGDVRRGDTTSSNPTARNLSTLLTARMVVRLDVFS